MAVLLLVIVPVLMPLGWHAENIGHSDTTKGQGKGESACLSSQDDLQSSLGSSVPARIFVKEMQVLNLREGRKAGSTDLLRHMLFFPFEVSESSAQIKEL
ncbi:Os05g0578801 [Oryza sativa Japonica Group]|uniref:Os05g0578801 protein n=1 Tax=Oryza sativa subsp. japonica TaxID=39947 RepID=C7J247_ORYSJ|nr:Os05g0578801 [Oryza sativa Japonica Group]|eukprot:NP_001174538.1 Os05g0578801 [Oryza sativa Japonica Group]